MDRRALKILCDTFWSSSGWKRDSIRRLNTDDFLYAKSKRLMFDPVVLDHGNAVQRLTHLVSQITKRQVADAFLASLSTRRLDWRSPLGSYAVFQQMPMHESMGSTVQCDNCGFYLKDTKHDLNVLSFERHKWGGVRHNQVIYAILDLELFLELGAPEPTQQDIDIFRGIIGAILVAPDSVTSATLHSQFATALKSNKAERDILIAILGYCGVLGTPEHPGYSDVFVVVRDRHVPSRRFVDMPYPACWWSGKIGVNQPKLQEYFSHVLCKGL